MSNYSKIIVFGASTIIPALAFTMAVEELLTYEGALPKNPYLDSSQFKATFIAATLFSSLSSLCGRDTFYSIKRRTVQCILLPTYILMEGATLAASFYSVARGTHEYGSALRGPNYAPFGNVFNGLARISAGATTLITTMEGLLGRCRW